MMKMKTKTPGMNIGSAGGAAAATAESTPSEWELRPGGMLVQKRSDSDQNSAPPPTIRVRVKYGSTYHQIHVSSQATFGNFSFSLLVKILYCLSKRKTQVSESFFFFLD